MTDMEIDPRLERIVWKSLGMKSVRQIAEETGLAPDAIFAIKRELYESVDVLSVEQKKQKFIVMLEEIAHDTKEDYDNAPYEFKSGLMNSSIAAMKTIMVELNKASKQDQAAIETLNALRVRELTRLIDRTVSLTLADIADENDLDVMDLQETFQKHLIPVARELESESTGVNV